MRMAGPTITTTSLPKGQPLQPELDFKIFRFRAGA